jgi:hypothetical protein
MDAQLNSCSFGCSGKPKTFYSNQVCKKGDTLELAFLKKRYQHNLNKIAKHYNVRYIEIRGRHFYFSTLTIPSELINHKNLNSVTLNKIKSDTLFKNFKSIYKLSYSIKNLDKNIFQCDSLFYLGINFKNGNLEKLISKENYCLKILALSSNKSQAIDSSLLYFKNLKEVCFNFNPFLNEHLIILKSLDSLKEILIPNHNFKNYKLKEEDLENLKGYRLVFLDCKFTREQKILLKKHLNIHIY